MSVTLTLKNLYDETVSILGSRWIANEQIEKETIETFIEDEMNLLAGDTGLLEGEFTGTGDGTNPYLEVNEELAVIRRVHYNYVTGKWGDALQEISPLHETGKIGTGDPTAFWVQSMHRYNRQRIYFDKIPATASVIRILFWKWPDDYASNDIIEYRRLWASVVKYGVVASFLVKDIDRKDEYKHYLVKKAESKAAVFKVKNLQGTGLKTSFIDV
ncbi:MAG: hypothetical protein ACUZ8H_00130 [Candidatus Anammoxibacter sp.]